MQVNTMFSWFQMYFVFHFGIYHGKGGQPTNTIRESQMCDARAATSKTRNSDNVRGRQTMTSLTGNLGRGVKRAFDMSEPRVGVCQYEG